MERIFSEFSRKDSVVRLMENREYLYLPTPILETLRGSMSFEKGIDDVNPEFIIEVMKIRSKILSTSPVHALNSQNEFTGIVYANYLNFMKEELTASQEIKQNKGRTLIYRDIIDRFIKKENEGLFKDSLDLYEFHIKEAIMDKLPLNSEDIQVLIEFKTLEKAE